VSENVHQRATRAPTDDELGLIVSQAKADIASYGCLILFFGVVPAIGFGWLGGWVGSFISPEAAAIGRCIGWAASAVILISVLVTFIPSARRRQEKASKDVEAPVIEELAVSTTRVVEIGLINDNEPILAFDIGYDKLLFLQGQWLRDPEVYGLKVVNEDPSEDFLNGLAAPHSFPSSSFIIDRLQHSGRVFTIRVNGPYLAPEKTIEALRPDYEFGDSEIFTGRIDDIAEVLRREHAKRINS
jgi:hypothetical protein